MCIPLPAKPELEYFNRKTEMNKVIHKSETQ